VDDRRRVLEPDRPVRLPAGTLLRQDPRPHHATGRDCGARSVCPDEGRHLDTVATELRSWLDDDLADWMAEINPRVDESVWIEDGLIDVELLADAIGLVRYDWGLPIGASPFSRVDMARQTPTGLLVLAETYTRATPTRMSALVPEPKPEPAGM